jgi:serine/threonine-protein kinase
MPPVQFGRYRAVAELGRGCNGAVLRGQDPESGQEVAIKLMAADTDLSRVKTLRTLNHPHIVQIYDFLASDNFLTIIMELLKGSFLQEILWRRSKRPVENSLAILSQIAEALDYAHQRGIIHGDLKPANVLIQEGDWATLTLFQIGCTPRALLGRQNYLAPEEFKGEPLTSAADQYHLALIAHEMLTGGLPWTETGTFEVLVCKVNGTYSPSTEDVHLLGKARIAALRRALDKDPPKRFASCREFIRALDINTAVPAPGPSH